ncbi:putative transcription factor MYB-HB-like family [Helianthus annuus]|uniref:Putative GBF's pro-rich region-interacting factor 1 n=1 Tax=Helianthus annuus TaxID=4232 RepID=A0A251UPJ2_HELAN|nr:transcription activator GLK1 [Helianthus annuus]KAF5805428.1 putative transcription factor MYB-related family [Helianthus annuus]KAJ0569860.1 putative transcription factor MYB-HB-like family [Helianthus annuus]KAJ0584188.1 putative transcription factor MYB-HB-like family [Helianthus annuus]KAJ0749858.1 putative transcription factor MYB-HB-like family [Helianthus annuus]KAJ0918510.1 putative transcription factor MYB-HB-like family [Helianthus annuus]
MLAIVSPLGTNTGRDGRDQGCDHSVGFSVGNEFPDFSDDNLLESIDFDDLFVGMDDQDMLPDLEMDPELLTGEFSLSGGEEPCELNNNSVTSFSSDKKDEDLTASKEAPATNLAPKQKETNVRGMKSLSDKSKNSSQGKRKVKVDWTPELHRRFVQAVEQLGVDKAVPSRILEIMGIGCLTRHNIASHLQKYRSHRKHLLAREAEAASWSHRRQMYGGTATKSVGGGSGACGKRHMGPWIAPPPSMGFPSMTSVSHYRPLHVWGHPSADRPLMPVWPKHIAHSPSPPPPPPSPHVWPPSTSPPPPWHTHHQRAPYFPQILPQTRFPIPHVAVPGIPPPHAMYKIDSGIGVTAPSTGQSCPRPPFDLHPTKESIDAAIGDILSKPWQPLPLGLKPPALDSVMGELHRQGIQKIPPTCI